MEYVRQEASKLATERDNWPAQNVSLQNQLDQLLQLERTNTAAVASTQANNEKLTGEVGSLRGRDSDQSSGARSRLYDNGSINRRTCIKHKESSRRSGNAIRNSPRKLAIRLACSMTTESIPTPIPSAVVPRVRGIVSKTQNTAGSQLIEITIGADDGLKPTHTVEIFRGDRYLGRAEILKTEPDRAVGRILRQFQQGQIEEGDDVATRFRIG